MSWTKNIVAFIKALFLGPLWPPEVTTSNVNRWRVMRLLIISVFVVCYLLIISLNSTKSSASVANDLRDVLYEDDVVDVETLLEQKWNKPLDHFMNGPTVSEFLNGVQQLCKTEALLEGVMTDLYECNIIQIDYKGLHNVAAHPLLPCEDDLFIDAVVEIGDGAEYGTIPFALQKIYDDAKTPDEMRIVEEGYDVHSGWGLHNPLFNTDDDKSINRMGPLPMLNEKLNLLGKATKTMHETVTKYMPTLKLLQTRLLKTKANSADSTTTRAIKKKMLEMKEDIVAQRIAWEVFDDDSWDFDVSSGAPRTPDMTSDRMIERNHHWDLLMRCDPSEVEVTFMIERSPIAGAQGRRAERLWWRVGVVWRRLGYNSNEYKPNVSIDTGAVYTELAPEATFLSVFVLYLFVLHIMPHVLLIPIMMPYWVFRIYRKQGPFKSVVYGIVDPLGQRKDFSPMPVILLENTAGLLSLFGLCFAVYHMFSANSSNAHFTGFETRTAAFTVWTQQLHLSFWEISSQILFGLWSSSILHAIAAVFYFIRIVEFTVFFSNTTMMVALVYAFGPLLNFSLIFAFCLIAYSTLLHVTFGSDFQQFSSLKESFDCLVLYSFGGADMWNAKLHHDLENDAYYIQLFFVSFQIIGVTMYLNMITTVVINSYMTATSARERGNDKWTLTSLYIWTKAKDLMGFGDEVEDYEVNDDFKSTLYQAQQSTVGKATNNHYEMLTGVEEMMETLEKMRDRLNAYVEIENAVAGFGPTVRLQTGRYQLSSSNSSDMVPNTK